MYQTRHIKYKSIFISGNDKETVEYKSEGIVETGDNVRISFNAEGNHIEVIYSDKEVILKNNQSQLKLVNDRMVLNEYQLPYGTTLLKTKLLNVKYSTSSLNLKYELYDSTSLISSVYIIINII